MCDHIQIEDAFSGEISCQACGRVLDHNVICDYIIPTTHSFTNDGSTYTRDSRVISKHIKSNRCDTVYTYKLRYFQDVLHQMGIQDWKTIPEDVVDEVLSMCVETEKHEPVIWKKFIECPSKYNTRRVLRSVNNQMDLIFKDEFQSRVSGKSLDIMVRKNYAMRWRELRLAILDEFCDDMFVDMIAAHSVFTPELQRLLYDIRKTYTEHADKKSLHKSVVNTDVFVFIILLCIDPSLISETYMVIEMPVTPITTKQRCKTVIDNIVQLCGHGSSRIDVMRKFIYNVGKSINIDTCWYPLFDADWGKNFYKLLQDESVIKMNPKMMQYIVYTFEYLIERM